MTRDSTDMNEVTGDLIQSRTRPSWDEVFAALDEAAFPDDFLACRQQGVAPPGLEAWATDLRR